jgi:hypothetical protein
MHDDLEYRGIGKLVKKRNQTIPKDMKDFLINQVMEEEIKKLLLELNEKYKLSLKPPWG